MGEELPEETLPSSDHTSTPVSGTFMELSRGDRAFLLAFSFALFALLTIYTWRLSSGVPETIEIRRQAGLEYQFQLNMNSATWVEWMQLDGLGEVMARRIVEDRDSRGPFRSVDDLTRVKGIGPATLAKLRLHLRCEATEAK